MSGLNKMKTICDEKPKYFWKKLKIKFLFIFIWDPAIHDKEVEAMDDVV